MGKKKNKARKAQALANETQNQTTELTKVVEESKGVLEEQLAGESTERITLTLKDLKWNIAGAASLKPEIGDRATAAEAGRWLDAISSALLDALQNGYGVRIPDIGTFSVVDRAERNGVNPQTREKIVIPARRAVHFSPAKALKASVNG